MVAHHPAQDKLDPTPSVEFRVPLALQQLDDLHRWLRAAALDATPAHDVERHVFHSVLQLGATLFSAFLSLVGPGDLGPEATLDDGERVRRLDGLHARALRTVFGTFRLSRHVYASREGQEHRLVPTDQRLQLPAGELSYLLQEWDQLLGLEQAFGRVRDTLEAVLRLKPSVDTLERNSREMAQVAPAFRDAQPPADPAQDGELLVVTEDNKGVPMVRPVEQRPAGARRKKGEKANKKQMACVGCVYSVGRNRRTPEELVATLFRDPGRPRRQPPVPCQRRYWAELSRESGGVPVRGQDLVFRQLAEEVRRRRKPGQVLVHLCDGQPSLQADRERYLPEAAARTVDVLDLMHVIPRLWEAAHLFHREGTAGASEFVRGRLLRVLRGEVVQVVRGLRRQGAREGLKGGKGKRLGRLCGYLSGNAARMRYDEYLGAGYPVASGVIEGACRHVIKDRLERAGMRWTVPGAQAMLHLRAIHANGDWEPFQQFRIGHETQRLYPNQQAIPAVDWPFAQAI